MPQTLPVVSDALACCSPLAREPLSAEAAADLAGILRAIADPTRLRLLSLIQAHEDGEACVCDLTAPVGLTQPTISHHLKAVALTGWDVSLAARRGGPGGHQGEVRPAAAGDRAAGGCLHR
jgi:ArsR family transcriptional regulator